MTSRWPAMLRGDTGLKVAIVGGASSTGGAVVTTPLSVARADRGVLVALNPNREQPITTDFEAEVARMQRVPHLESVTAKAQVL